MVFVFYNKVLLRVLVFLTGGLCATSAWHYIALSSQKLGEGGVRDALAIVSFLLAGWLVMLIAEVADNHYVRAFGALSYLMGAAISFKWIFVVDGPQLAEMTGGAQRLQSASLAFWGGAGLAFLMLAILVTRLVLDKASFGQHAEAGLAAQYTAVVGERLPGQGESPAVADLPSLTVDQSPLLTAPAAAAVPSRSPAPVLRLLATAGPHSGASFVLRPGELTIGRQSTDILLDADPQVSRNHAVIEIGPDGLARLRDNGSTNGSWVNGQRVTDIVLAPGDQLQFGTSLFSAEA